MELSFGEQIKILLSRKNMTIQELADLYEQTTGCKMSRQNLAQRLKRDNFPEQDMRIFARLLGCNVSIQLIPTAGSAYSDPALSVPTDIMYHSLQAAKTTEPPVLPLQDKRKNAPSDSQNDVPDTTFEIPEIFRKKRSSGDINPLTGQEYLTNTVRRHPYIDDYIQVYDQTTHSWSDVEEDYFWEFQRSKKQMMGSDYQEPLVI